MKRRIQSLLSFGRRRRTRVALSLVLLYLIFFVIGATTLYLAEPKTERVDAKRDHRQQRSDSARTLASDSGKANESAAPGIETPAAQNENAGYVHIHEPKDAFWPLVVFLTSGIQIQPRSGWGRVVAWFFSILGTVTIGGMIVAIATTLVLRAIKKEPEMPENTKDHIVICNWNERGDRIVEVLHCDEVVPNVPITIITPVKVAEDELRRKDCYMNTFFVQGDPTLHTALEKGASVHLARAVIILADDTYPDPDAKSALIALAARKVASEKGQKTPYIVAEAMNHRKTQHLMDAGVNETVCANDYGLSLLGLTSIFHGLTKVYTDLLTHEADTCEFYVLEGETIPKVMLGRSFDEMKQLVAQHQDERNPLILVGVRRGSDVILNPRRDTPNFDRLREGDALVVISYWLPSAGQLQKLGESKGS